MWQSFHGIISAMISKGNKTLRNTKNHEDEKTQMTNWTNHGFQYSKTKLKKTQNREMYQFEGIKISIWSRSCRPIHHPNSPHEINITCSNSNKEQKMQKNLGANNQEQGIRTCFLLWNRTKITTYTAVLVYCLCSTVHICLLFCFWVCFDWFGFWFVCFEQIYKRRCFRSVRLEQRKDAETYAVKAC